MQEVVYTVQMLPVNVLEAIPSSPASEAIVPVRGESRRHVRMPEPEVKPRREPSQGRSVPAAAPVPAFSPESYMRGIQERLAAATGMSAGTSRHSPQVSAPRSHARLDFSVTAPASPSVGASRPVFTASPEVGGSDGAVPEWFVAQIRSRVRENWIPERRTGGLSAVVSFRLLRNGRAEGIVLERSSGNILFDRAALDAVRRTTRFPPFPEQIHEDVLDIAIEFSTEE